MRTTLFTRILFWFFMSLVVLGGVLFGFFNLQFRLGPQSPLLGKSGNRIAAVGELISHELRGAFRGEWNVILDRYSDAYQMDFVLCSNDGHRLAGKDVPIPPKVIEKITKGSRSPRLAPHASPPPQSTFTVRTTDPTRYWIGVRIPIFVAQDQAPMPATLMAVSDSIKGSGLFLDPMPWLIVLAVVVFLSVILWVPMVRNITRPISQVTEAAQEIARGRFDVRLNEKRTDELGRLGRSINEMAARLGSLVRGQKRFLGDVAHELASPVARIQVGLGILEQRGAESDRERVRDVMEDVSHMSDLVDELLSFSRADAHPSRVTLQNVNLAWVVRQAKERECSAREDVRMEIDDRTEVVGDSELLTRAVSNLLRNAVLYAGDAGPISVTAKPEADEVTLEVRDSGPGVPEEILDHLFEPFYRPDESRGRETGGVGLGLAIVKTCIHACQGTVTARNVEPAGLAVTLTLKAAAGG